MLNKAMKHWGIIIGNSLGAAACGAQCWIPTDLTDRRANVQCKRCRRTKAFKNGKVVFKKAG